MAKRSYRKKSSRGKGSKKGSKRTYRKKGSKKSKKGSKKSKKGSKKSKKGSKKTKRCPKGQVRSMRKLASGKLGKGVCIPKPFGAPKPEVPDYEFNLPALGFRIKKRKSHGRKGSKRHSKRKSHRKSHGRKGSKKSSRRSKRKGSKRHSKRKGSKRH